MFRTIKQMKGMLTSNFYVDGNGHDIKKIQDYYEDLISELNSGKHQDKDWLKNNQDRIKSWLERMDKNNGFFKGELDGKITYKEFTNSNWNNEQEKVFGALKKLSDEIGYPLYNFKEEGIYLDEYLKKLNAYAQGKTEVVAEAKWQQDEVIKDISNNDNFEIFRNTDTDTATSSILETKNTSPVEDLILNFDGNKYKKGKVSQELKRIQKFLNENGANLVVDGKIGPKTRRAIELYQANNVSKYNTLNVSNNIVKGEPLPNKVGSETIRQEIPEVEVQSVYGGGLDLTKGYDPETGANFWRMKSTFKNIYTEVLENITIYELSDKVNPIINSNLSKKDKEKEIQKVLLANGMKGSSKSVDLKAFEKFVNYNKDVQTFLNSGASSSEKVKIFLDASRDGKLTKKGKFIYNGREFKETDMYKLIPDMETLNNVALNLGITNFPEMVSKNFMKAQYDLTKALEKQSGFGAANINALALSPKDYQALINDKEYSKKWFRTTENEYIENKFGAGETITKEYGYIEVADKDEIQAVEKTNLIISESFDVKKVKNYAKIDTAIHEFLIGKINLDTAWRTFILGYRSELNKLGLGNLDSYTPMQKVLILTNFAENLMRKEKIEVSKNGIVSLKGETIRSYDKKYNREKFFDTIFYRELPSLASDIQTARSKFYAENGHLSSYNVGKLGNEFVSVSAIEIGNTKTGGLNIYTNGHVLNGTGTLVRIDKKSPELINKLPQYVLLQIMGNLEAKGLFKASGNLEHDLATIISILNNINYEIYFKKDPVCLNDGLAIRIPYEKITKKRVVTILGTAVYNDYSGGGGSDGGGKGFGSVSSTTGLSGNAGGSNSHGSGANGGAGGSSSSSK